VLIARFKVNAFVALIHAGLFVGVSSSLNHVCQLAGNARHIGIGSDLDGAFGREQSPADLDTIADLARLPSMLAARGYTQTDIEQIMHENFIRFLKETWR